MGRGVFMFLCPPNLYSRVSLVFQQQPKMTWPGQYPLVLVQVPLLRSSFSLVWIFCILSWARAGGHTPTLFSIFKYYVSISPDKCPQLLIPPKSPRRTAAVPVVGRLLTVLGGRVAVSLFFTGGGKFGHARAIRSLCFFLSCL